MTTDDREEREATMSDMFRSTVGSTLDPSAVPLGWNVPDGADIVGVAEFMAEFGGATFSGGLYRVHDAETADVATRFVRDAFPEHADHVRVFGYDWLGRQFALDPRRLAGGQPQVLMLEPGTGDALEVPATFVGFHDEEMVEYADAVLAIHFFDESRWGRTWLPFLADGGGDHYVAELSETGVAVRHVQFDELEHPVEFTSLASLFRTVATAMERGVVFVEDGYLEMDDLAFGDLAAENERDVAWWRSWTVERGDLG
jgi:hypothetical protein